MKKIVLTQGKVILVDDRDYEYLARFTWHVNSRGYAVRNYWVSGRCKVIFLHRLVAERAGLHICGLQVDHINGIKLNNQHANLRAATNTETEPLPAEAGRFGCFVSYGLKSFAHDFVTKNKTFATIVGFQPVLVANIFRPCFVSHNNHDFQHHNA